METIQLSGFSSKLSVPVTSIEYVEGTGNYSIVYIVGKKPLCVALTLKRLTERLPTFLRIHKSTLVNPAYVVGYRSKYRGAPFVRLSKDRVLAISRRRVMSLRPYLSALPASVH